MKKTKILLITIISVALAIIVFIGGFFAANSIGENNYWNSPVSKDIVSIGNYDEKTMADMMSEYDEGEQECIDAVNKNSSSIPAHYKKLVSEINSHIANYYQEKYSIDVSERLDNLNLKQIDFPIEGIAGYYNNYQGDNVIYMDNDIFSDEGVDLYSCSDFISAYIHETNHYLGTTEIGSGNLAYIFEGFTEYLTIEILDYSKLVENYADQAAYTQCVAIVKEMLKVSPEIVKHLIENGGKYDLEKELNSAFDGQGFADQLNCSLQDLLAGDDSSAYTVQLLGNEYLKACGANDSDLDLCSNFGFKWLLN